MYVCMYVCIHIYTHIYLEIGNNNKQPLIIMIMIIISKYMHT